MPFDYLSDDSDEDEDWYDDDDEPEEEETADCPECGEPVSAIADKCPSCGYWLSDADRRAMWSEHAKPLWLRVTAAIVLIAFLISLFAVAVSVF